MTKLFKNSKSVLSIALAFAVLAVSLFTGVVINTEAACTSSEGTTLYWDGTTVTQPTQTDDDGNTLITSAAELAYITSNAVTGSYKVADGINAIVLQSDTYAEGIMALADYAATQAYFEDTTKTTAVWKNGGAFQGTFDGNGVTIYGMYSTGEKGGLFGTVYESSVIKNVSVKNSYIKATKSAGALVGCYTASSEYLSKNVTSTSETNPGTWTFGDLINLPSANRPGDYWTLVADYSTGMLAFDKCVVSGCYISSDSAHSTYGLTGAGVWLGVGYACLNLTASNMLVYSNKALANDIEQGITGILSTKHTIPTTNNPLNNTDIKNCIILDCVPYTVYDTNGEKNNQAYMPDDFTNVYTNTEITFIPCTNGGGIDRYNGVINEISAGDIIGSTDKAKEVVSKFNTANSETVWMVNPNGYPELSVAHKNAALTDNGDGTHSLACECGVYSGLAEHNFVDGVCECGAEFNCAAKKTIYWNGTKATKFYADTDGASAEDPIIINTAEELAYVATATYADTYGKYFKIADEIGKIVLQSETYGEDIVALDSAQAVKDYFEPIVASDVASKTNTLKLWLGNTWNPAVMRFSGNFDGNGVEIYGMYNTNKDVNTNYTHNSAGGLFCIAEDATISNFAIKNSYTDIGTSSAGWCFGLVVSYVKDGDDNSHSGNNVYINNCTIANNYINKQVNDNSTNLVGVVCGSGEDAPFIIQNLLVYGNIAKGTTPTYANYDLPVVGGAANGIMATEEYATAHPEWVNANGRKETVLENSVVLGTPLLATNAEGTTIIKSTWCVLSAINDANNCYENVYTDWNLENIADIDNFKKDYFLSNCGNVISASDASGAAATNLNLDWTVWMANADGYPVLRAAHDDVLSVEPYAEDNYAGHVETCSCGLGGLVVKHDYDENYYCPTCEFTCDHEGGDAHVTFTPVDGDCLTTTSIFGECDCGFTATIPEGSIPGHTFTYNEEVPSDCQTQGTAAYNYCPNCDKKYAADADRYAAFETALSDEDLMLALGEHVHAVDEEGVPVYAVTDAGHQKICGVCSEAYGDVEVHDGTPVDNGDGTHSITCTVAGCGYAEESAPHVFEDGDNVCDICGWICESHTWVDDGEPVELGLDEVTDDACKKQAQKCDICGIAGEDKLIEHTLSDWETPFFDRNKVPACASDGSHTESRYCTECYYSSASEKYVRTVTDPKTGHAFTECEAAESTCTVPGNIEYKYCPNCNYSFAMDAADDEPLENALEDSEYMLEVDPEAHKWVEYKAKDATCEESGYAEDHKYCTDCYVFAIGDEITDIILDYSKFYEEEWDENWNSTPIGIGAIAGKEIQAVEDATWAEFVKEKFNIEVPVEPGDDATEEDWDAYYAALNEYYSVVYSDMSWQEEWAALWLPTADAMWQEAYHAYYVAEAAALEENPVDLVIPATGHDIVKVDEVAATYDKEGTKAHYACENCDKLFSDAEGTIEVTEEDLVIAKLVKEENKPSTDDKTEDKTENKTEGDKSDKSPATGESVASVAAVAALMGAAFVLVRKARKA